MKTLALQWHWARFWVFYGIQGPLLKLSEYLMVKIDQEKEAIEEWQRRP